MILLYYPLSWLVWALLALPLLGLALFSRTHRQAILVRFFIPSRLPPAAVHIHLASLGEARALRELVESLSVELAGQIPGLPLRMSVTTGTGLAEARSFCPAVSLLPFENFIPFWLTPCRVLVIFEAEYWFMLAFVARLRGARVIMINARIPQPSFQKYLRLRFFYRAFFGLVAEVFAQSEEDARRLKSLGARGVRVGGNVKLYAQIIPSKTYTRRPTPGQPVSPSPAQPTSPPGQAPAHPSGQPSTHPSGQPATQPPGQSAAPQAAPLLILANTHRGEEELLLPQLLDWPLILAPRHPQRFGEVAGLLRRAGLGFVRFSELDLAGVNEFLEFAPLRPRILLLDAIGELVNFYSIADVVVLGGSFVPGVGGHSPVEPAKLGRIIITGPHIFNQRALFECCENVHFCEDLADLSGLVKGARTPAKIREAGLGLGPIIKSIKEAALAG